ncbi:MAG: LptA/OstA family protein [bacterium]
MMLSDRKFFAFAIIIFFVLTCTETLAQPKPKEGPPIITSDTIEMLEKGKIIAFKGNVKLVKGDTVITADEMTNFVDKDLVIGKGNVHCVSRGKKEEFVEVKSTLVEYFDKKKIAILTGNPWAYQDSEDSKGEYSGDKMTVFTEQERLIIEGNAKSVIYPKNKPQEQKTQ